MRIMTVLGSPRRHGNTATVLRWVHEKFQVDGHDVDHVNMLDFNVGGCKECLSCKKGGSPLCILDDDVNGLFQRMVQADLVLIAAPVFCWGFPAQIKGLIDRFYCLMDFDGPRTDIPRLTSKPMSLLLTAGGEGIDNADLVSRGFKHLVELLRAKAVSNWLVPNCTDPDAIDEFVHKEAIEFATKLLHEASL
jgi:multimeric flavodoxin WrbA